MAWHATWNQPGEAGGEVVGRRRMSGVKFIVLVTVAVYIADWMTAVAMRSPVGLLTHLGALRVQNAWLLYPLLTYQFLHSGLFHIGLNMLVLWMLGRHIERHLGRRPFLYMYFLSGALGGLFQVAFGLMMARWYGPAALTYPTVGASGGVMGILMAFAVLYPRQELYVFILLFPLPIQARWLALAYFLIESIHAVESVTTGLSGNVANAAHVGGMVLGFVWTKWGMAIARWWRASAGDRRERFIQRGREEEAAEMDRILQKVHETGTDSLTTQEKLFLQEMSEKYRDRF